MMVSRYILKALATKYLVLRNSDNCGESTNLVTLRDAQSELSHE